MHIFLTSIQFAISSINPINANAVLLFSRTLYWLSVSDLCISINESNLMLFNFSRIFWVMRKQWNRPVICVKFCLPPVSYNGMSTFILLRKLPVQMTNCKFILEIVYNIPNFLFINSFKKNCTWISYQLCKCFTSVRVNLIGQFRPHINKNVLKPPTTHPLS